MHTQSAKVATDETGARAGVHAPVTSSVVWVSECFCLETDRERLTATVVPRASWNGHRLRGGGWECCC